MIPIGDWQFWFVTVLAIAGAWWALRTLFPRRNGSTACGGCGSGKSKKSTLREKRAALTVEGRCL